MRLDNKHLEEYEFCIPREGIPQGWEIVSLNDISFIVTDGTHKTPEYMAEGVRFISIKNIRPYRPIDWDSYEKYISRKEHNTLIERCHPEFDDILFPRIGTLGFAKRIDFNEEVSIFVGLGLIKPIKAYILPKYLEYYMNTPYIGRLSFNRAKGTGRKTLPLEESRRFPFPVAPLPEQQRIVAKIEELFSELDKGIESLKAARAKLDVYRQAVLKDAFEGKLTAQWREENKNKLETPEQLLSRIKKEREKRYEQRLEEWKAAIEKWEEGGKSGKRPVKPKKTKQISPQAESELTELPEGWSLLSIAGLLSIEKKGMTTGPFGTLLKKSEHRDRGIPVLGIENIGAGHFVPGNKVFVTEKKAYELDSFRVESNDIIISRSGTVGEICKLPYGLGKAILSTNLLRLSLNDNVIDSNYFVYLFQGGGSVKDQVRELCKGSTREFLNQTILSAIRFPVPSLSEQQQIVAAIEARLSVVNQLETDIEKSSHIAAALRQSILKKAFSGQLVPQDPDDEPASVLLERIKVEKAARSQNNTRTKRRRMTATE